MKIFYSLFSTFWLITLCNNAYCQNVPNYAPGETMSLTELANYRQSIWDSLPAAVGWVNDFEGIFSKDEEDTLESLLEHFEKKTTIEIAVVTVDTNMVTKENLGPIADRLLRVWGIGKITKSNGIVIVISKGYREIKISTDFGIDKYINEYDKYELIKKSFVPLYQKKKYYEGTLNGLNAMLAKLSKKSSKSDSESVD